MSCTCWHPAARAHEVDCPVAREQRREQAAGAAILEAAFSEPGTSRVVYPDLAAAASELEGWSESERRLAWGDR